MNEPGHPDYREYTYDFVGNRKTLITPAGTLAYVYDPLGGNRLAEIREGSESGPVLMSFQYDNNGNLRYYLDGATPIKELVYDQRNQVRQITVPAGTSTFGYDAAGYRVEKTDSSGLRRYLLEDESIESIHDGSGLRAQYLRGVVVDEIVNGHHYDEDGAITNLTFHHDQVQTVTATSGHAGTVEGAATYTPFGETVLSTLPADLPMRYTGRELDADTGLYYYRARYYDPALGRFLSEDPLGFEGGDGNLYAYVANNPLNANDPSGKIVDLVLDVGFIAYDVYELARNPSSTTAIALGLDVAGAFLPGATGLGALYRSSRLAPTSTFLREAATQAIRHVDTAGLTARAAGRRLHNYAESYAAARRSDLWFEQAYLGRRAINYRAKGSTVPDVIRGSLGSPTAVYDFKFGNRGITSSWERRMRSNLPLSSSGIPIREIRPYTGGYQRLTGAGALYNSYSSSLGGSSAGGGYVLYPGRPNLNSAAAAYAK